MLFVEMKLIFFLSFLGLVNNLFGDDSLSWNQKYESWLKNSEIYGGEQVLEKIKAAKDSNATSLNLANCNISDITPISELTELRGLFLFDNNISDISVISNLTKLNGLNLINNQIKDVTPILGLKNLRILGLSGNPIPNDQIKLIRKNFKRTKLIVPKSG